jgi:hypothetical protein
LVVGAPLPLAVVELFHPYPYDILHHPANSVRPLLPALRAPPVGKHHVFTELDERHIDQHWLRACIFTDSLWLPVKFLHLFYAREYRLHPVVKRKS